MMHNRNDSANSLSNSSSLSSISLHDSVEIYRSLEEERARVEKANTDLHSLVNNAERLIDDVLAYTSQSTYTQGKGSKKASVNLAQVMKAMLFHAEECGGLSGKRYVASAVVACSSSNQTKAPETKALASLGVTWLTHLLFICTSLCAAMVIH